MFGCRKFDLARNSRGSCNLSQVGLRACFPRPSEAWPVALPWLPSAGKVRGTVNCVGERESCCVGQAPDGNSFDSLCKRLDCTVALLLGKIIPLIHHREACRRKRRRM